MRKIDFTKMVASGNDFVIIELNNLITKELKSLSKEICDRREGIGADGLLLLEKSKVANIKMRIFNPDGTEAEMCGNGLRCVALYSARNQTTAHPPPSRLRQAPPETRNQIKIETKAGIIESEINKDNVKIKLTYPKNLKLDLPIKVNNRILKVNFVNTGVPHTVIFVEGLDKIDIQNLGRTIRWHKRFQPEGTNVDFVEILNKDSIKIRTYERGVEDETLSCGTGAVAAVLTTNYKLLTSNFKKINVYTKSREILKVNFDRINDKFTNIWLEGKAKIVYTGVYYV